MSALRALQSRGLCAYLRAVRATSTVHVRGLPEESAMVTLFHESLLVGLAIAAGNPKIAVFVLEGLVTRSIMSTIEGLGLKLIAARPGNAFAVGAMRDWVRRPGHHVLITLDGPHGPWGRCRPGVARLARLARVPVSPVLLSATRGHELETWDRVLVPEPFGRLTASFAPLIDSSAPPVSVASAVDSALHLAATGVVASRSRGVAAPARWWVSACVSPLAFGTLSFAPSGGIDGAYEVPSRARIRVQPEVVPRVRQERQRVDGDDVPA